MLAAEYAFLTAWLIKAPVERVWDELYHVERWINWWEGLLAFEALSSGDSNRVGFTCRLTWKGVLPYRLVVHMRTVRLEPPVLIESAASGELEGRGIWRIKPQGEATIAEYDWRVKTTKAWMNWVVPLARPVFSWNHHVVMRGGEEGLKRLLEPVLAVPKA